MFCAILEEHRKNCTKKHMKNNILGHLQLENCTKFCKNYSKDNFTMNINELLEAELGKDKEHDEIVSQREKFLKSKISEKEEKKEKTLRGIEKMSDEFMGVGSENDLLNFIKKYGSIASEHVTDFLHFALDKLEKYQEDEQHIEIPIMAIPTMQGMLLNSLSANLGKTERKLLKAVIEKVKPQNKAELLKILSMSSDEIRKTLGKNVPGLDIEDLEEFVNKVSKDSELKTKMSKLNKSLNRLYGIYAKNKHLSTLENKKKIEL